MNLNDLLIQRILAGVSPQLSEKNKGVILGYLYDSKNLIIKKIEESRKEKIAAKSENLIKIILPIKRNFERLKEKQYFDDFEINNCAKPVQSGLSKAHNRIKFLKRREDYDQNTIKLKNYFDDQKLSQQKISDEYKMNNANLVTEKDIVISELPKPIQDKILKIKGTANLGKLQEMLEKAQGKYSNLEIGIIKEQIDKLYNS